MKIYEVFLTDIWNNNYLMGFYKNLDDAIPDINSMLPDHHQLEKDDIAEYPSTLEYCFDACIGDVLENKGNLSENDADYDELSALMIRGFILDGDEILSEIQKLNTKEGTK